MYVFSIANFKCFSNIMSTYFLTWPVLTNPTFVWESFNYPDKLKRAIKILIARFSW